MVFQQSVAASDAQIDELAARQIIARDPVRFRPLMPATVVEKFSFGIAAIVLYVQGRLSANMLGAGLVDLVLGTLFIASYFKTPKE